MNDDYDNVTFLPFGKKEVPDEPAVDQDIMQKIEMNMNIVDAAAECESITKGILFSVTAAIEERIPITDRDALLRHMSVISCLCFGALMQQRQVACKENNLLNELVATMESAEGVNV